MLFWNRLSPQYTFCSVCTQYACVQKQAPDYFIRHKFQTVWCQTRDTGTSTFSELFFRFKRFTTLLSTFMSLIRAEFSNANPLNSKRIQSRSIMKDLLYESLPESARQYYAERSTQSIRELVYQLSTFELLWRNLNILRIYPICRYQ